MRRNISNKIGIIAEDDSDVDSVVVLIRRILERNNISHERFIGSGSSKIPRKCKSWSILLWKKGCSLLLVVHDADTNNPEDILKKINDALKPCPFAKYIISVPVQELEAWLLSDPVAIKEVFSLHKVPKIRSLPEDIDSPKEYLGRVVKNVDSSKLYLNTVHNKKIAELVSLEKLLNACPSFKPFYSFIDTNLKV